jgi:phenylalanyl-tRNA synthetase beta subunit
MIEEEGTEARRHEGTKRAESGGGMRLTPDLSPTEMELSVAEAAATIGAEFNAGQLAEWLESMGHGVQGGGARGFAEGAGAGVPK